MAPEFQAFRRAARDALLYNLQQADIGLARELVDEVPSDTNLEQYDSFSPAPAVQDLQDGPHETATGVSFQLNITNVTWGVSMSFNKDRFDDDNLGAFQNNIGMLGTRLANQFFERITLRLFQGDINASYDGSNFFANAHNDWTGDNALTTVVAAADAVPSLAEMETSFDDALASMLEFTDARGLPIHYDDQNLVMVGGPRMRRIMKRIETGSLRTNGETNTFQGESRVLITPHTEDTSIQKEYILAKTTPGMRPLIYQNRSGIKDGVDVDDIKRTVTYWAEQRYEIGYGKAYSAIKQDFTT